MDRKCKGCGETFKTNRSAREYCSRPCSNSAIACTREDRKVDGPTKAVWSCGGGVQSTAIAALICAGKLPKPDYAIITDVGYEKTATFGYVKTHMIPRLADVDVELHIVKTTDYTDNSILNRQGYCRLPAYVERDDGQTGRLSTHCSGTWKTQVARRWMREQGIRKAANWIGISTDEARRTKSSGLRWIEYRYPLVDLGISREGCLWLVSEAGWPRPSQTSCYICPQQDDASWLRTKQQYPDDWARAIAIEQEIQRVQPNVYLHRSLVPLPDVQFKFGWQEAMGECTAPGVQCWG